MPSPVECAATRRHSAFQHTSITYCIQHINIAQHSKTRTHRMYL